MWYTPDKYKIEVWAKITDYVLTHYNEPIKEAKALLGSPKIDPDYLTAEQIGMMSVLLKKGFFKKTWNPLKGGTYYWRTDKEAPKMKLKREEP